MYAIVRSNISDSNLNKILTNSKVTGITYYVGWSKLNPRENVYNFSLLKKILENAKKYNKSVNLGILTGRWSPKWLENKKVKYVYWRHSDNYVENGRSEAVKAPVPWDNIVKKHFKIFLLNFKLIVDENKNIINAINITGGSNTNGIETNFICSDKELKKIGFSYSLYINNWKKQIDNYAKLFPNITLTLAIHDIYGSKRTNYVSQALIDYCRSSFKGRIKIAAYAFTEEKWFGKGNSYADLVLDLPSNEVVLQSIRIYSKNKFSNKFSNMRIKADNIQPAWLEVWAEDVNAGLLNVNK